MPSLVNAIKNTIPISQFNRGLAGKIFTDIKNNGPKVVMKNNAAEAVILPPDEYVTIMDELNDYFLLTKAVERMASFDPDSLIPEEEVNNNLGVTAKELDEIGEVEFE